MAGEERDDVVDMLTSVGGSCSPDVMIGAFLSSRLAKNNSSVCAGMNAVPPRPREIGMSIRAGKGIGIDIPLQRMLHQNRPGSVDACTGWHRV